MPPKNIYGSDIKMYFDGVEFDHEIKDFHYGEIELENKPDNYWIKNYPTEISLKGELSINTQAKFNDKQADKYLRIARRTKSARIRKKNERKFRQRFMELLFGV